MPEYLIIPTFIVVWCITMFAVIPFGLKAPDKENPHHYNAAPTGLSIKKKIIINTVVAVIVTALMHVLFSTGWVPLREAN